MGICELLTLLFIALKLLGIIDWNWFFVLLPEIIAFVLYVVLVSLKIFMSLYGKEGDES